MWTTDSWTGIDLTPDLTAVAWADLSNAQLELAFVEPGETLTTESEWLYIPIQTK